MQHKITRTVLGGVALCTALLIGANADAAVTRIDFTGVVSDLTQFGSPGSSLLQGQVTPGDAVSGTVRFSDDATTGFTSPTSVFYSNALQSFAITVGSFQAMASSGLVDVSNDHQAGSAAPVRDGLRWDAFDGVVGNAIAGVPPVRIQLSLLSADLGVLTDTDLPTVADIQAMASANVADGNTNFLVWFNDTVSSHEARFRLTSITVRTEQVPEPAVPALVAAGLLAALVQRARRRR
jgi:hypothetical protein